MSGPFLELGIWLEPQKFQEGKQKQCQSQEACSVLSGQMTTLQEPVCRQSQLERSGATSFQSEVMPVPHPTSSFLPLLANSQTPPVEKLDCLKRKSALSLPKAWIIRGMVDHSQLPS